MHQINYTCYSGGADGADMAFELLGLKYGIKVVAYSFHGHKTDSMNRYNLSKEQLLEGWGHISIAAKSLKRYIAQSSDYTQKLLSRDYFQAKSSDAVFAISRIVNPKELGTKFVNKATIQVVDGGTGYCVQCAIDMNKPVYVFNMKDDKWYSWNYDKNKFAECEIPILTKNFAGVGSRDLTENGYMAIKKLYENTFKI
jgi:hypothetical protein